MKLLLIDLEFNTIPGYPDYAISRCGKVLSLKPGQHRYLKLKKPRINHDGYIQIKINKQWKSLHRLLALTYLENSDLTLQVNHKDGNKLNNSLDNLEWVTQRENLHHAMRTGLHDNPEVAVYQIDPVTGNRVAFISLIEAQKQTGVWQANITKVLLGQRPKAGGYFWERV